MPERIERTQVCPGCTCVKPMVMIKTPGRGVEMEGFEVIFDAKGSSMVCSECHVRWSESAELRVAFERSPFGSLKPGDGD